MLEAKVNANSVQGTAPGATIQAKCPSCGTNNQAETLDAIWRARSTFRRLVDCSQAEVPHTGGSGGPKPFAAPHAAPHVGGLALS